MSFVKITPLFLFLILLVVLVISALVGNRFIGKEGYVSYQETKTPREMVVIPTYSTKHETVKLYDSLYFDNKNGNIIEVDSTSYAVNGNVDTTGITIATTNVVSRDVNVKPLSFKTTINNNLVLGQDTAPSLILTTLPSYHSYIYKTQSANTDSYSVFCFPWNTNTFIFILNGTNKSQVGSFYFDDTLTVSNKMDTSNKILPTSYIPFTMPSDDKVSDTFYDTEKPLYQISQYVKYDVTNGNLIVQTAPDGTTKSIDVYARNNGTKQTFAASGILNNTASTITNINDLSTFTVLDGLGQNLVVVMPFKTNTVIALIGYTDTTMKTFTLNNVCRFTATTIDKSTTITPIMNPQTGPSPTSPISNSSPPIAPPTQDSAMSEYFKWYWYWKNNGQPNLNYTDDYLLKTQIVPPVCPSCPMCSGGPCTNCGGNGGSGTLSHNGNTVAGGASINNLQATPSPAKNGTGTGPNANYSNIGNGTFSSNADPNTIGGSLTLATYDTVAGVEGVAQTGAGVLNTATGTVGSVANKALDTVGNIAGGVTGLVGGAGTGAAKILTQNNGTQINNQNMYPNNNQTQLNSKLYGQDNTQTVGPDGKPITINRTEGAFQSPYGTSTTDQYSYYGSLSNKGQSNFMPLTADFSAFGR